MKRQGQKIAAQEIETREEARLRDALVTAGIELVRSGLNQGTAGNISARFQGGMLITPSGVPPHETTPDQIAAMPLSINKVSTDGPTWHGPSKPSSEWRLHRDILAQRDDVGAIVHTHSCYATVLATQHREIPALHYMIAAFGGSTIRCAPYAPFGTQALSDLILDYLGPRHGVLLGNHGMVATGKTLEQAMWRAAELESLAKMFVIATLGNGTPIILPESEIEETIARFANYGMTARA